MSLRTTGISARWVSLALRWCPVAQAEWTEASNGVFREQFRALADLAMDDMRQGTFVRVGGIDDYIEVIARGDGATHTRVRGRAGNGVDRRGRRYLALSPLEQGEVCGVATRKHLRGLL